MAASRVEPRAAAGTDGPVWRKPLLVLHIVAAVSLIGADLVLVALAVSGLGGAAPQTVYPAAAQVASWVIGPLVLIALATGLVQAIALGWGLARYWWVATKLSVAVVFTGVVWFVLIPRLGGSAEAALAGEAFSTAERLPLLLVPSGAVAVLIGLVALAVTKPAARLRRPR